MVAFEQVRQVLVDDPGAVVAEAVSPEDRRERRFRSELGVNLGAGGGIRQAVDIELGGLRVTDDGLLLPIRWQASGRARLFPVFEGRLSAAPEDRATTRLEVKGIYTVPLGPVGRFGDGLVGRRLARQSLRDFMEDAADRIEREVHRRAEDVAWHPAEHPVALRELQPEEQFG